MNDNDIMAELQEFAEKKLNAGRFPEDTYRFSSKGCSRCGLMPFAITIEHHTGSKKSDFKGVIIGRCSNCDTEERLFSFTGSHRKPERREKPRCRCGSRHFIVAECERFEGADGLPGFFDEGVVIGKCSDCGRMQVFVFTD